MTPPSKRPSRESVVVQPTSRTDEPIDNVAANKPAPERSSAEDTSPHWPLKPSHADKDQGEESSEKDNSLLAGVVPETTSVSTASEEDALDTKDAAATGDEGSLERFESLSRSGLDFEDPAPSSQSQAQESTKTEELKLPEETPEPSIQNVEKEPAAVPSQSPF